MVADTALLESGKRQFKLRYLGRYLVGNKGRVVRKKETKKEERKKEK
jgi:hypothetical protein